MINLRGDSQGEDWYDQELATSKALGIRHYDFPMSDREELSQDRAMQLVALTAKAEKPIEQSRDRSTTRPSQLLQKMASLWIEGDSLRIPLRCRCLGQRSLLGRQARHNPRTPDVSYADLLICTNARNDGPAGRRREIVPTSVAMFLDKRGHGSHYVLQQGR